MVPEGQPDKASRILIVDDHPQNVILLKRYLRDTNYEILEADCGIEAIEKARTENPDLILLDVILPEMDGYEVCRKLKSSDETEFIPIIMMTALSEGKDKLKALDAGADDFISKPFNQIELIARLRSLIRIKNLIERVRMKEREQVDLAIKLEKERMLLEKEKQIRQIFREILLALTQNKLHLILDPSELGSINAGDRVRELELNLPTDVVVARKMVENWLDEIGVDKSRRFNMVVCVSEAATNVIKHAGIGKVILHQTEDKVQVWVQDRGMGIDFSELPKTTLLKGYSTKVSLGMGYTIMLELMDKIYLLTTPYGTLVIMEMNKQGIAGEIAIGFQRVGELGTIFCPGFENELKG